MDLIKTIAIAASGMRVQGQRMEVVSENIANADSLPTKPGGDPYRRKVVLFRNTLDRELDIQRVKLHRIQYDKGEFEKEYDPNHPGAGADGYVRQPNVNTMIEVMDMREAQRSYEANLQMIEVAKGMLMKTLSILQ
jgi:flagellar basal-body rod protein FlgC